jgi:poly-gamma-glutamate capsule biosynthesis protein CapA/YwtB (metallophosphatase superfamily)
MTSISIAAAGQALLHGALDLKAPGTRQISRLLKRTDAAFVNLEASLATEGAWPTKTKTLHLTSAEGIVSLKKLGFDALTHANNHAFDLGPPGIACTRSAAEAIGLGLAGSGRNRNQAARPALVRTPAGTIAILSVDLGPQPDIVYASAERAGINPLRVRRKVHVPAQEHALLRGIIAELGDDRREAARAAVGYRASDPRGPQALEVFGTEVVEGSRIESRFEADTDDLAALASAVEEARSQADIVAVAIHNHHWDPDWGRTPGWVMDLSRDLIDCGADLIVGTGAPVLQRIGFHRGKPILAGLGNLIFHTRRSETYDRRGVDVWTGAICRCVFDVEGHHCLQVRILPVSVGRPSPESDAPAPGPAPLADAAAKPVFEAMTADLSDEDRLKCVRIEPDGF